LAAKEGLLSPEGDFFVIARNDCSENIKVSSSKDVLIILEANLNDGSHLKQFIKQLMTYKTIKKTSDFINEWLEKINPVTGRIHSSLNQLNRHGVGRFSSSQPNIQQIPRDKDLRSLFKVPQNRKIVTSDLSSIEMCIIAQLSKDKQLIDAFQKGICPHIKTAAFINGKPLGEIDKESPERQSAKAINYGLIYGMSAELLKNSAETNYGVVMALEKSRDAIEKFFKLYRNIESWHESQRELSFKKNKYIKFYKHSFETGIFTEFRPGTRTIGGRLRIWPTDIKTSKTGYTYTGKYGSMTEMYNSPIQGTCADIIKIAMIMIFRKIIEKKWDNVFLINTVHDELVLEAPEELADEVSKILNKTIAEAAEKFIKVVEVKSEGNPIRHLGEK
jgi:DNA polymerase I-like protein with 3'-5' exonuclease and polymerase domains